MPPAHGVARRGSEAPDEPGKVLVRSLSRPVVRSYDPVVSVDQSVVGKYGRVTGKVAHGTVGEVMLAIRGGVEAFYAYPAEGGEEIEVGAQVVVLEYEPPRTVVVTRLS
jgi:hypothetical protein